MTMTIRGNVASLQRLESAAADKCGLRFCLLDEKRLLGRDAERYIGWYVRELEEDISDEVTASAGLGFELRKIVPGKKVSGSEDIRESVRVFRLKVALEIRQWRDRMKLFIVENQTVAGMDSEAIGEARFDPKSKWSIDREALNKKIKRHAAGLVNRVHFKAFTSGRESDK